MKFKIGDKVKILPSAVIVNVVPDEIGKTGEITTEYGYGDYMIKTDSKQYANWWVRECDIAPVVKVGQQLLFSFMIP